MTSSLFIKTYTFLYLYKATICWPPTHRILSGIKIRHILEEKGNLHRDVEKTKKTMLTDMRKKKLLDEWTCFRRVTKIYGHGS